MLLFFLASALARSLALVVSTVSASSSFAACAFAFVLALGPDADFHGCWLRVLAHDAVKCTLLDPLVGVKVACFEANVF